MTAYSALCLTVLFAAPALLCIYGICISWRLQ